VKNWQINLFDRHSKIRVTKRIKGHIFDRFALFLTSFQKKKDYKQNVLRNCTVPPHLQIKGRLN